ncbi:MAG: hypothetical protein NT023_06975 [Armatimonadetes bacterium]|nr:hypothetical protein [Armatimonadota bacterium]
MSSSYIADFKFTESGISLLGHIANINRDHVVVEFLPTHKPLNDQISAKVDILFMLKGTLRQLGTRLIQSDGLRATLQICDPLREVTMRRDTRHPCTTNVHFRHLVQGKTTSVWKEGSLVDIGLGGICIELPYTADTARQGEVLINLTEIWLRALWENKLTGEPSETIMQPDTDKEAKDKVLLSALRFRGKVCYTKPAGTNLLRVGMKFADTHSTDNLRLARILMDVYE